jgi:hypothetical protein
MQRRGRGDQDRHTASGHEHALGISQRQCQCQCQSQCQCPCLDAQEMACTVHRADGHPRPQLPAGDEHGGGHSVGCLGVVAPLLRDGVDKRPQACPLHPRPRPNSSQSAQKHSSCCAPVSRAAFVSRPALLHCCIASGLAALAAHACPCAWPNLAHKHTPTFISHVSPGPSTASSSRTSRPLSLHRREHATCKPPLTRAPCRRHEFRRAQPPRHV